jgi:hypothetical protein
MSAFVATTPLYHMRLTNRTPHWNVTLRNTAPEAIAVQAGPYLHRTILQPGESMTIQYRAAPKFAELNFWVWPTKTIRIGMYLFKSFTESQRGWVRRALDGTITLKIGAEVYPVTPVPAPAAPLTIPEDAEEAAPVFSAEMEEALRAEMAKFEAAVRRAVLARMAAEKEATDEEEEAADTADHYCDTCGRPTDAPPYCSRACTKEERRAERLENRW